MKSLYCHMRHILQICHIAIFLLFSRLKGALKRHGYADIQAIQAIQTAVTKEL
jgi:hypothetical protein